MRRISLVVLAVLTLLVILALPATAQNWGDDDLGSRGASWGHPGDWDDDEWRDDNDDKWSHNNWWRPQCDWFWSWWWGWQRWCWHPWWGWYIAWWW